MEAFSLDLRERIIRSWQQGQSKAAIARTFMVSLSTVKRYIKRYELHGHVMPTVQGRMQSTLNKRLCKRLLRQVSTYPDYTLAEHANLWNSQQAVKISASTVGRALQRLGWTRKKKTLGAVERNEVARRAFKALMKKLKVEDVVVIDESSTRIGMIPIYARSPRGCRAYDRTIRNYGQNITLLAGLNIHGIQAAMTLEGAVDRTSFEVFISKVLLPTLREGQIVIMDNLSSHKTERVQELLRRVGCRLLFLPTYSPDLSPIEEAFSKLKAFIRRYRCKTVPTLMKAIEQGFKAITATDAQGWFAHAGFCV